MLSFAVSMFCLLWLMCRNQDLEMEVSQLKVEVGTMYQSCLEFEEYKKRLDSNAK